MKALLFYPDNLVKGTVLPPYSLLYLAKALMKKGHEAVIIDGRFKNESEIENEISDSDLFAVSAGMNMQFATSLPFMKMAKDNEIPVLLGGVFSTLNFKELLKYPNIDGICLGEGEISIVEAIENGVKNASNVAYLNGDLKRNPQAPFVDLNDYSPLPWELLNIEDYVTRYKDMNLFYYTTSRGCPHRCDYCYQGSFWNRKWRGLGFEQVKEEIDAITKSAQIDALYLFDDNFMVDRNRAERITRYIHDKGLKWSCMTRANYLNESLVDHIKNTGCFKLNIGSESGSQNTLNLMKKDIHIEDTIKAAELIGEADLNSEFYFMIGYRGETLEDIEMTVDMADEVESLCDAETFIRVALPFKGTRYFESAKEGGFRRDHNLISLCTEDWGRRPPYLPWFTKEENKIIRNIATMSEIRFMKKKFFENMPLFERLYIKSMYPFLESRWKRRKWKNFFELALYNYLEERKESKKLEESIKIVGGNEFV